MNRRPNPHRDQRFFYGWYIVGAGLITYALGYGARYSFSVVFPSLLEEFKGTRDVTAAILSIHFLAYGASAPLAGFLVDRVGPRFTIVLGAILLSFGLTLSQWGGSLLYLYCSFGILSGMGLSLMGAVPFTNTIKNWFERKRGLAFSIIVFGTGGAFAFYPAVAWLIHHVGWRTTFVIEAIVISGVVIPLVLSIIRYHPRELGRFKDGMKEESLPPPSTGNETLAGHNCQWPDEDWTFPHALKNLRFWLIAFVAFSLWGVADHILVAHHIAFAIDVGYSKIYASSVLSLFGLFRALGSLSGLISDRIGRELTLTIGTLIAVLAVFVFLNIQDTSRPWMLYFYAVAFGLGVGLCSPTIMASIVDIVQGPRVGVTIGVVWFSFALGGMVGPWLGGWLFELYGNYTLAFIVAIAMFLLACIALWVAAPRKSRRRLQALHP